MPTPAPAPPRVFVARWTGSAWETIGGGLEADSGAGSSALAPSLIFDGDGAAVVAWQEGEHDPPAPMGRRDLTPVAGGTRDRLTGSTSAFDPHLALIDGGFVLGWRENNGAETHVNADRWNGSTWAVLASNVDATPSVNTSWMALATDSSDRAVLVWEEPTARARARSTPVGTKAWSSSSGQA